ncbi:MAG: transporter substrate-binding domain-containing protein [Actinobacteria bacterium]|nr:transporter substrate-binding domain-containing protein [Actinomycetota bacterium]
MVRARADRTSRSRRFRWFGGLVVLVPLVLTGSLLPVDPVSVGAQATTTTTATRPPRPERTVRVAISVEDPFVVKRVDTYGGFSVELWEEIAKRNNYRTEYVEKASVQEQLDAVRAGQADLAIGDITVTAARAETLDFTEPTLNSGLQIMVRSDQASTLSGLWKAMTDPTVIILLVTMAIAVAIAAVLIWLLERNKNPDFAHNAKRGFAEGSWWASVTMLTVGYGDRVPRTGLGRIFSVLWMVFGVLIVAVVTAAFTANLTLHRLNTRIESPDDLRDYRTVTVRDSSASMYLSERGIPVTPVATTDEMIGEVRSGAADAAVFGAPVLANAVYESGGNLALAGPQFTRSYDAIAVGREASDLRNSIDRALLVIADDGQYDRIYRSWFSV